MDYSEFLKWVSGLGVGGLLAAFIFDAYRKDRQASTDRILEVIATEKDRTHLLVQVVKDNTSALVQVSATVQSLHEHIIGGDRRFSRGER